MNESEKCVSCSLHRLQHAYYQGTKGDLQSASAHLSRLFSTMGWNPRVQDDPDNINRWIFQQMEQELPSSVFGMIKGCMGAVLSTESTCKECKHKWSRDAEQTSLQLALDIRLPRGEKSPRLSHYVDAALDVVTVDFDCPRCESKGEKVRRLSIKHAPEFLEITLQRINNRTGEKLTRSVPYAESLDLTRFSATPAAPIKYQLAAIVSHAGSMDGGHYICMAADEKGHWTKFDDADTSRIEMRKALDLGRFHPYLLFFRRVE